MVEESRGEEEITRRYQRARASAEAGQWPQVVTLMEDILNISPRFEDPEEHYSKAQREIEGAEQMAEQQREMTYNKAMQEMEGQNWQVALDLLSQLRLMDPTFKDVGQLLSRVQRKIKEESASTQPVRIEKNLRQRALSRVRSTSRGIWVWLGIWGLLILCALTMGFLCNWIGNLMGR
jgi:hypothetical protein